VNEFSANQTTTSILHDKVVEVVCCSGSCQKEKKRQKSLQYFFYTSVQECNFRGTPISTGGRASPTLQFSVDEEKQIFKNKNIPFS
jgi:hypothetical protein